MLETEIVTSDLNATVGKGPYGDMLKAVKLHERTARRLIAIAENRVLTNPEYHARLPVSMPTVGAGGNPGSDAGGLHQGRHRQCRHGTQRGRDPAQIQATRCRGHEEFEAVVDSAPANGLTEINVVGLKGKDDAVVKVAQKRAARHELGECFGAGTRKIEIVL